MDEEEQVLVEEMTLTLEAYPGSLAAERDDFLGRLRDGRFLYYGDYDIRDRAKGRLELLGVGCYVFYNFEPLWLCDNGSFIKVGSTIHDPESRAYSHIISSSSQSDIIGVFGADYVLAARFGLIGGFRMPQRRPPYGSLPQSNAQARNRHPVGR